MWFRFLVISVIKWFLFFMVSGLFLQFVVPESWRGYQIAVPLWALAFLVAFVCAEWAFRKRLPEQRDIMLLLGIWMTVTITLQLLFAQFILGSVLFVINSPDIYIQYLMEIVAIFLSAKLTRKRKVRSVISEGLSE